ncbi:MAG TPA: cytochrome ubiquinol oxidase subunit I, partial [Anaeromyxobacteraceae bacterium]|nr:cytochrome ubiquinol oxidase subunit I [Anaeromyxobacteraceae bacterium]
TVGGLPDVEARETRFGIEIPYGLSLLAFHDPHAEVRGLDAFPRDTWPNVRNVHLAFQVMVGLGSLMALVALAGLVLRLRKRDWPRWFLKAVVVSLPLGFVALEAGWLVTEWGRQPFAIVGVQRTADAVTPVGNLTIPLVAFALVYVFLAVTTTALLARQIGRAPKSAAPAAGEGLA